MKTTVIDNTHFKALIYLALTEGLIEIDSKSSDNRDMRILKNDKPNSLLKDSILEQVVFNPNFIANADILERDWIRGNLFDDISIKHESITKNEFSYEDRIPPAVIDSMLRLKNSRFNFSTGLSAFNNVMKNYELYENYFKDKAKPQPEGNALISSVVHNAVNAESEYSDYELDMRTDIYFKNAEINSFTSCFSDYFATLALSKKVSGLFCIGTPTDSYFEDIDVGDNQIKLYKLVVDELGELPHRNTLRESILLSKEPETIALREQINHWSEQIFTGDVKGFIEIKKDIKKAITSLSKRHNFNKVGKFCTYIGVPASAGGFLNPFVGVAGLTISVVGAACTKYHNYIKDKYKYAMFGNK